MLFTLSECVDFFHIFIQLVSIRICEYPISKYLNLTFGWECNDTPSLIWNCQIWPVYLLDHFFNQFFNSFSALLSCKINSLDIVNMVYFFLIVSSIQTFGWDSTCHTFLILDCVFSIPYRTLFYSILEFHSTFSIRSHRYFMFIPLQSTSYFFL